MKVVLAAACLALLGCQGCATWRSDVNTGLEYAHKAGEAVRLSAGPLIDARCEMAAQSCIDNGIRDADQCVEWVVCKNTRRKIAVALVVLHSAIMDAKTALAIGDEDTARAASARAIELISDIRRQLIDLGVIK